MYENFRHPKRIAAEQWLANRLAARRVQIETYLNNNGIPVTDEIIERYYRGYRRRLLRRIRPAYSVRGLYVFVRLPVAILQENVPASLPWNTKLVDDVAQPRTFEEYLVNYRVTPNQTQVVFMLCGKPDGRSRPFPVGTREINRWRTLLENRGYDWTNAANLTQFRALVKSWSIFA